MVSTSSQPLFKMYFWSNGKLLLTAEYAIMDGAVGLALPTRYGQDLEIISDDLQKLTWQSFDKDGVMWFSEDFLLEDIARAKCISFDNYISKRLYNLLCFAKSKNPDFLENGGAKIISRLDFFRKWGLGTSSTLVNNIAQWAEIDAFELLWSTFKGSGYDVACAQRTMPIIYQLKARKTPLIKSVTFFPKFHDELYFVYFNHKQDTQKAIANYRKRTKNQNLSNLIDCLSSITQEILNCTDVKTFETLIEYHEQSLSSYLKMPTLKQCYFSDYARQIKSLGAWGGDFFLATGKANEVRDYFHPKGYNKIFPFSEIVLTS